MNPPRVYTCFPSWTPLPHTSQYHPSGSSQCTSPEHPVSCIEPGLVIRFIYDIIHVSMPFSQNIPPSPSPTESKRLFYTSVSLLLSGMGREVGGVFRMGNTCTPVVDACWCIAKPIQYCKVKNNNNNKIFKKVMLLKCCTQYASKFGKLSSGHRTGKGQFLFQNQRRAMPKIVQNTAQLYSSHTLAK